MLLILGIVFSGLAFLLSMLLAAFPHLLVKGRGWRDSNSGNINGGALAGQATGDGANGINGSGPASSASMSSAAVPVRRWLLVLPFLLTLIALPCYVLPAAFWGSIHSYVFSTPGFSGSLQAGFVLCVVAGGLCLLALIPLLYALCGRYRPGGGAGASAVGGGGGWKGTAAAATAAGAGAAAGVMSAPGTGTSHPSRLGRPPAGQATGEVLA